MAVSDQEQFTELVRDAVAHTEEVLESTFDQNRRNTIATEAGALAMHVGKQDISEYALRQLVHSEARAYGYAALGAVTRKEDDAQESARLLSTVARARSNSYVKGDIYRMSVHALSIFSGSKTLRELATKAAQGNVSCYKYAPQHARTLADHVPEYTAAMNWMRQNGIHPTEYSDFLFEMYQRTGDRGVLDAAAINLQTKFGQTIAKTLEMYKARTLYAAFIGHDDAASAEKFARKLTNAHEDVLKKMKIHSTERADQLYKSIKEPVQALPPPTDTSIKVVPANEALHIKLPTAKEVALVDTYKKLGASVRLALKHEPTIPVTPEPAEEQDYVLQKPRKRWFGKKSAKAEL